MKPTIIEIFICRPTNGKIRKMATNAWLKVAGVMGASAVALGAIGAHAIPNRTDQMKEIWKTAATYHLIHSATLGYCALNLIGRKRNVVCSIFTAGIILFSGSCYAVVLMNERKPYGSVAPFGGTLFIAGWLALGFM